MKSPVKAMMEEAGLSPEEIEQEYDVWNNLGQKPKAMQTSGRQPPWVELPKIADHVDTEVLEWKQICDAAEKLRSEDRVLVDGEWVRKQ
jgi:hypothetical protein